MSRKQWGHGYYTGYNQAISELKELKMKPEMTLEDKWEQAFSISGIKYERREKHFVIPPAARYWRQDNKFGLILVYEPSFYFPDLTIAGTPRKGVYAFVKGEENLTIIGTNPDGKEEIIKTQIDDNKLALFSGKDEFTVKNGPVNLTQIINNFGLFYQVDNDIPEIVARPSILLGDFDDDPTGNMEFIRNRPSIYNIGGPHGDRNWVDFSTSCGNVFWGFNGDWYIGSCDDKMGMAVEKGSSWTLGEDIFTIPAAFPWTLSTKKLPKLRTQ